LPVAASSVIHRACGSDPHASDWEFTLATWRQMAVACVTRRYPLSSGCARLANHQWVHRAAGAGRGDVWAHVPGGQVLASLDDYIGRAAFFVGDLDRKITTLCW
jgi:hypothetical protein